MAVMVGPGDGGAGYGPAIPTTFIGTGIDTAHGLPLCTNRISIGALGATPGSTTATQGQLFPTGRS